MTGLIKQYGVVNQEGLITINFAVPFLSSYNAVISQYRTNTGHYDANPFIQTKELAYMKVSGQNQATEYFCIGY